MHVRYPPLISRQLGVITEFLQLKVVLPFLALANKQLLPVDIVFIRIIYIHQIN